MFYVSLIIIEKFHNKRVSCKKIWCKNHWWIRLKNNKQLEATNTRIQDKLESYQELYDTNQRLISLGKKISILAKNYHNNKKKKKTDSEGDEIKEKM